MIINTSNVIDNKYQETLRLLLLIVICVHGLSKTNFV